jgi:hypothetical protein
MIRVKIPHHLSVLAQIGTQVDLEVESPVTLGAVLDALETRYPVLRGTIRDQVTGERRPFLRFFACGQDLSHNPPDTLLPDEITSGAEPLFIIGAIAGG